MDTLEFIKNKYNLDLNRPSPIEIPDVGRDDLGGLFKELGFKKGVELGVEQGVYSEILCKGNPGMRLFGVDAWASYRGYRDHVSQKKLDGFKQATLTRMKPYKFTAIQEFSMDALNYFEDGELDFVYVDANHTFVHVAQDIFYWAKKVRVGGIVAGHDYRKNVRLVTTNHVAYVVPAFMEAYRKKPWFLLGTKKMVEGQTRDKNRSWMFVQDGVQ